MSLHGKKKLGKKDKKGDIVTRFWYTIKNLDPSSSFGHLTTHVPSLFYHLFNFPLISPSKHIIFIGYKLK